MNTPRLSPSQTEAGTRFTYNRRMEGWVDLGDWLHTEMVYRRSPIQVLFQQCMAGSISVKLDWSASLQSAATAACSAELHGDNISILSTDSFPLMGGTSDRRQETSFNVTGPTDVTVHARSVRSHGAQYCQATPHRLLHVYTACTPAQCYKSVLPLTVLKCSASLMPWFIRTDCCYWAAIGSNKPRH